MKIEMLYPEVCNLFGDISNIKYLKKCLPDAEIIKTEINSEPAFVTQDVDMIYMGPMPENIQEVAIRKLRPYKERIEELIKKNVVFLVTGNAVELFGKYIENEDGSKIEALSIFNIYAKRDMMHRHNSIFLGKYEEVEIVGFKSQFTMAYGDNENNYFAEAEKGIGLNKESKLEGIKQNNFIGTYLIGPILILNPLFTKKLIQMLGVKENFLPIGSVVKLKGGQKRLMITGFLQVEQEENKKNVWDYSGCLYPEGMITSENNYVFNHSQIEDIYFTGLVDEEEEEFKKRLKEAVKELKNR